jgi:hypothetical protein
MDNGIVLLSVSFNWMDILAAGMTGLGGDSDKACFNSWSSTDASNLATLPVAIESQVSPDGDDATWPRHLQDQVGIV